MSVKERIKEYLAYKKLSMRKFSHAIGVSSGYVNSINKSMQPDKIDSIAKHYPDLDIAWLLTGEGDMIKSTLSNSTDISTDGFIHIPQAVFDVIQKQANSLERRDRQIDELISMLKKTNAQRDEVAGCADASGM